jgi:hypothetical protein
MTGFLRKLKQQDAVKELLCKYVISGVTDKQELYSKVVDDLAIARPTVRRIAAQLRKEMTAVVLILSQDIPKPSIAKITKNQKLITRRVDLG